MALLQREDMVLQLIKKRKVVFSFDIFLNDAEIVPPLF